MAEHQGINFPSMHPDWHLFLDAVFVVVTQSDSITKVMLRVADHAQLGKLIFRLVPNTSGFQLNPYHCHLSVAISIDWFVYRGCFA